MLHVVLALALAAAPFVQNAQLKQALQAYDEVDYDKAGPLFDQALKQTNLTPADQKVAWIYAGMVYFTLDQRDKAREVFTKALQRDPTIELDEFSTTSKLRDFFGGIKKEVLAATPAPGTADVPPASSDAKPGLGPLKKSDSDLSEESKGAETPVYKTPLFWVAVGATVVVAGVVTYLVVRSNGPNCSTTSTTGCMDLKVQQQQGLVSW